MEKLNESLRQPSRLPSSAKGAQEGRGVSRRGRLFTRSDNLLGLFPVHDQVAALCGYDQDQFVVVQLGEVGVAGDGGHGRAILWRAGDWHGDKRGQGGAALEHCGGEQ